MALRTLQRIGLVSVAATGLIVLGTAVSGVASIGSRLEAADRTSGPAMSRVSLRETGSGAGVDCPGHTRGRPSRELAPPPPPPPPPSV